MSKRARLRTDLRPETTGPSSGKRRLTATVGGLVLGVLAGRLARPGARRIAARYGMPSGKVTVIVETALPLIALVMARGIAGRADSPPWRWSIAHRIGTHRSANSGAHSSADPSADPSAGAAAGRVSDPAGPGSAFHRYAAHHPAEHHEPGAAMTTRPTEPNVDLR